MNKVVKEFSKCIGIRLSNATIINEIIKCGLKEDSKGVKNAAEKLVKNLRNTQPMIADGIEKEMNKTQDYEQQRILVSGRKCDYGISISNKTDSITNIGI